ncbi:MAG: hypothetical protein B6I30_06380 [Desulfobacteraceae bacterium 4572_187]|nr:MAG: hypothetical protein B6I30_06380 [Desulfobacteraceae bacterium 4572_187]
MSRIENEQERRREPKNAVYGQTLTKGNLIQLAAAAAIQSEGSVHSHTRRALQAGVTKKEIYHALILLISILGFPRVSAAISWSQDIMDKEDRK